MNYDESDAWVANQVTMVVWLDQICKANNVVQNCQNEDFIDHLPPILLQQFVRLANSNSDHLENQHHNKDEYLEGKHIFEENDTENDQNSPHKVQNCKSLHSLNSFEMSLHVWIETAIHLLHFFLLQFLAFLVEKVPHKRYG